MQANAKLTLDDIADVRAYERTRAEFRERIRVLKSKRRVHIGTIITLVFENRETMLYQIQEMARVEKLSTDQQIQAEIDIYNPIIPEPGYLSATLFIECTTDDQMREWFPKLVGIERSVEIRIGEGDSAVSFLSEPDEDHAAQLTREEMTAAVHYVHFKIGQEHAEAIRTGPVTLAVVHPNYNEETELLESTRVEFAVDVAG